MIQITFFVIFIIECPPFFTNFTRALDNATDEKLLVEFKMEEGHAQFGNWKSQTIHLHPLMDEHRRNTSTVLNFSCIDLKEPIHLSINASFVPKISIYNEIQLFGVYFSILKYYKLMQIK